MGFIENYKKRRAIKSFIYKLPGLLKNDYGKSKTYTPMQVKRTIERNNLSVVHVYYGIAMFSTKVDFDTSRKDGEILLYDYDEMRCDIADSHFNGDSDFSVSDIVSLSSSYGGGFDDIGEAGGFDGGGAD